MTKKAKTRAGKDDERVVIQTKPGSAKDIGGSESENWNLRQMRLVISALPGVNTGDKKNAGEAGSAVISGMMDVKPTDPVEAKVRFESMSFNVHLKSMALSPRPEGDGF